MCVFTCINILAFIFIIIFFLDAKDTINSSKSVLHNTCWNVFVIILIIITALPTNTCATHISVARELEATPAMFGGGLAGLLVVAASLSAVSPTGGSGGHVSQLGKYTSIYIVPPGGQPTTVRVMQDSSCPLWAG